MIITVPFIIALVIDIIDDEDKKLREENKEIYEDTECEDYQRDISKDE